MAKIDLPFVQRFKDRHGKVRHYFRRPGHPRRSLPGLPGSDEFMAAYRDALALPPMSAGQKRTVAGTFGALFAAYYQSTEFADLQPQTQRNYRHMLEPFREKWADAKVKDLGRAHIRAIIDARRQTPGAAKNLLKRLRVLLDFAVSMELRADNPARAVKGPRVTGPGFLPWGDEHIEQFEAYWPSGTRERLALALLLYTTQRRSDVVKMGRQHVRRGKIRVTQKKRGIGAEPTVLMLPIHPALQAELDLLPATNLTFLMTAFNKPFTGPGFTNWFVDAARKAGLPPGYTPHGLRKAGSRRLAEGGASAHGIASVTGHQSLEEVERYTKSANQERLATRAMKQLKATKPEQQLSNPTVKPTNKR